MSFQIFPGIETFSSHKLTFILKGTRVPDLLVKKSGRAKKENGERGSDVFLQEMIGALHAHVWVKAAEQYA